MTHDDWIIFIRSMDMAGIMLSVGLIGAGLANGWAVLLFFVSCAFALASMIADGAIGTWREQRDKAARMKAAEEAQRMGRQFRRMQDLFQWEAQHGRQS